MKVFISWSKKGSASHKMALLLRDWIPLIIQTVEPYVSSEDIEKGERWFNNITDKLKNSTFGIICVTKENMQSQWIHFEAGAMSHFFDKARICPLLINLTPAELKGPLAEFQTTIPTEDDIFKLLDALNQKLKRPRTERQLKTLFDAFWPQFEAKLKELRDVPEETFWNVFLDGMTPKENVYIVLSAKWGVDWEKGKPTSKPGHTAQGSYNEVDAFFTLQQELYQIKDKLKLAHGGVKIPRSRKLVVPEYPKGDETLIIIGSPHANILCNRIMSKRKNLPYRFGMNKRGKCIKVYQDEKGHWFKNAIDSFPSTKKSSSKEPKNLEEDFGIISRITNPLDAGDKHKVLILAGNHGFGTESAVKFIANDDEIKFLHKKVEEYDFEALFEACVGRDKGLKLGLRKLAILKYGKWQPVRIRQNRVEN